MCRLHNNNDNIARSLNLEHWMFEETHQTISETKPLMLFMLSLWNFRVTKWKLLDCIYNTASYKCSVYAVQFFILSYTFYLSLSVNGSKHGAEVMGDDCTVYTFRPVKQTSRGEEIKFLTNCRQRSCDGGRRWSFQRLHGTNFLNLKSLTHGE